MQLTVVGAETFAVAGKSKPSTMRMMMMRMMMMVVVIVVRRSR